MAWRLRYQVGIDYVAPGQGPMSGVNAPALPSGGAGNQTLELIQNPSSGPTVPGTGTAHAGGAELAAADVTALLAAMSADLSTQLNAQLARLNNWPQGGALSIV